MDDFFLRALLAGSGFAIIAGPLGCFVIWRKLAYFGDTLAHSALLGVALGILLEINFTIPVFIISAFVSLSLLALQRYASLSSDALLGLLAHSALAIGLVVLAFMTWVRVDLMGFLFGDILAVNMTDIYIIWVGGPIILFSLSIIWKTLFAVTVNVELAKAEGMKTNQANIIFMLLMAAVIAISLKIVGVLLVTALLIIPAAAARRFASGPEQMAILASIIGVIAIFCGLFGSLTWDTPAGPTIVLAALILFLTSFMSIPILKKKPLIFKSQNNSKEKTNEY